MGKTPDSHTTSLKLSAKFPVYAQALLGMVLGIGVGLYLGKEAVVLGDFSKYLIEAIKWVAMPLLFFAILDAILRAEFHGRGFVRLIGICALNGMAAITIALILSNLFEGGKYLPLTRPQGFAFDTHGWVGGFEKAFSSNNKASLFSGTTAVIICALGLGTVLAGLKKNRSFAKPLLQLSVLVTFCLNFLFKAIEWIVLFLPLAVFGSVAKAIGLHGLGVFQGLAVYFILGFGGMFLQVTLTYHSWIRFYAGIPLKRFWNEAKEPVIYSFGINSSLATLPITLRSLKRLNINDSSARLSACVGTNFNNDGILLYEVVAALFLIQAYGITLGLPEQFLVAFLCLIACIGVAGVPEAGIISLTLVLSAVHLPVEALSLLLSVDWVLARCRSMTNVLGDMTCAVVLDKHV